MEESSTTKEINLHEVYRDFIDCVLSKRILFLCKSCSCLLFTEKEINAVYVLDVDQFAVVIDPSVKTSILNIKKKNNIFNSDDILGQNDCLYEPVLCRSCSNLLGSFIVGTTNEKSFLSEKVLVNHKKFIAIVEEEMETYELVIDKLVKMNPSDAEEYKRITKVNQQLYICLDELKRDIAKINEFNELRQCIKESAEYVDELIKLSSYLKVKEDKT